MKTKLTITVDREVLPKAKQHARLRGVSLSRLVEENLRKIAAEGAPSFSQRWRGAFHPAGRGDERYKLLARKYL